MSSSVEVRVAKDADYQSALEIRRKVFVEGQGVPMEIEVDEFETSATHFVALLDGRAVGAGRFRLKKCYAKFERIATLEEARGKGVGRAMMAFMQEFALKNHPEYLPAMHAQATAVSFYEGLGWVAVGDPYMEAGIEHRVMVLPPKNVGGLKALKDPECSPDILAYLQSL